MAKKNDKVHNKDVDASDLTKIELTKAINNMNTSNLISTPLGVIPIPPDEEKSHKNNKR